MKVRELIAILTELDQDAQVLLMTQQQWPFENGVHGVAVRAEIEASSDDEDDEMPTERREGCKPNDVFIVEGSQLRYGSNGAWDVARR